MAEKAKIQYVGQFYIHGSAAKKLEPRKILRLPKTKLPAFRPNHAPVRYFEPVAIATFVLSLALVLTMGLGMLQLQEDWKDYQQMKTYVSDLRADNAELVREYREAYDMAQVESKALGLGLVPVESVKHITVTVTPAPHVELPELSWVQKSLLFWEGLWA